MFNQIITYTNTTFPGYENIAVGKAASQSSTRNNHGYNPIADKAVDGLVDGNVFDSITVTNRIARSWWEVDLGANEIVYGVTIYNRLDDCCRKRLQNFNVSLTDASGQVTKTTHFGVGVFVTYPVHIPNGVVARKVKVQLRGTNYLSLAEMQVWAGNILCFSAFLEYNDIFNFNRKSCLWRHRKWSSVCFSFHLQGRRVQCLHLRGWRSPVVRYQARRLEYSQRVGILLLLISQNLLIDSLFFVSFVCVRV